MDSSHLESVIRKHNGAANLQVVFCDIEKYSKRRSATQTDVIDGFTSCLKAAITEMSKTYVMYSQQNDINFQKDLITIPTGDGAAIAFSFDGLHDIHLNFSEALLKEIYTRNNKVKCERFQESGWCNCHDNFNIRVGISEAKGIIYKDLNDNFNVAGTVINLAARVMGHADKNQILFTEEAYKQLIDMVDDPSLSDKFAVFSNVKLKHGLRVNLFQYKNSDLPYINSEPPYRLVLEQRLRTALRKFTARTHALPDGFPPFPPFPLNPDDYDLDFDPIMGDKMLKMVEGMSTGFSTIDDRMSKINELKQGIREVFMDAFKDTTSNKHGK